MEKNWQISYVVEELFAPKEGIMCDEDILFKRGEKDNEAYVFIKITEDEKDKEGFPKRKVLEEILQLYALETMRHTYLAYYRTFLKTPINEKIPFGQRPLGRIPVQIEYPLEQLKKLYSTFKSAVGEYKVVQGIFKDVSRTPTRLALEYYHKALGEYDIRKRLVDLVVVLESLFAGDSEIRYKVSLRIASFLGFIGKDKKKVFERVYDLYQKRSNIVHGAKKVKLYWGEVYEFEEYLRECCRIFIYLDKDKNSIIKMLDDSLLDDDVKKKLTETVSDTYNKWKTSEFRTKGINLPRQTKAQFSLEFIPK